MNQGTLISTAKSVPSFPALAYQGTPVLTSEMLAQAYGVSAKQIRQNFNNNRERFVEGKHFFSITGQELSNFRLQVDIIDAQISPKARILTLWADRGSARHAKMLESDRAWDMYELLEDTFFSVSSKAPAPQPALPTTTTPSTADDRRPLDKLVKVWAQQSGTVHAQAWTQVNAHFNLDSVAQLPVEWIPDAIAFVEGKITALSLAKLAVKEEQKALPEAAPVLALTTDEPTLEEDIMLFAEELRQARAQTQALQRHLRQRIIEIMASIGVRQLHASKSTWVCIMATNLAPYVVDRCREALLSYSDDLDKFDGPASMMMSYAGLRNGTARA